jgi:voltage-dependent anion channel protein 2
MIATKLELDNTITDGLKVETQSLVNPAKDGFAGQKLNIFFKQSPFHFRGFTDYLPSGAITTVADATFGYEGFLVGGEVGYDVQKAAVTRYSASAGYAAPTYTAAVTATQNMSVFTALFYQKVNAAVEAGAKAVYDAKSSSTVGIEFAAKYKVDPLSFAKVG